ncbi:MAG: tetratricopeptide repeat protein [Planctomycetota bacterium]
MFDARRSMFDGGRLRTIGIRLFAVVFAVLASHLVSPASAGAQTDAEHQQFLFAYKLLQRGDFEEAADEFDEYLGSFPDGEKLGDAQYYRALLYRKQGQNERASALLAGAADPTLVPAYAVDLLHGQVLSDLGRFEQALASLEGIDTDALEPRVAVSAFYLRGLAYRGADNLEAAATALSDAAQLDTPMRARALLDLAKVQALMEEPDAAVETLDRCLAVENLDTSPEAARFAGDITYNQGHFDDAIAYYGQVVARFQSSAHFAPAVVGTLWAQFGAEKYDDLLTTFDRFRDALPVQDRLAAWYLAGSAQQELGNHEAAVGLLLPVSRGDGSVPLQEKVLYKLAVSQYHLGEHAAMAQTIGLLVRHYPDSALKVDLAFMQASADAEQGEVQRGAARLTQFVEEGADSPYYQQALLRRAHLYETHGQTAPAARDYRAYLASVEAANPTSIQATFRLIELATALAEHDEAKTLAQQVLAVREVALRTPEVEQEALYRLAVSERYLGNLNEALAAHDRLADRHPLNPYSAESSLERGLIHMKLGDPGRGVPLLLDASRSASLPLAARVGAMRIAAQHYEDHGDADLALALRREMEDAVGLDGLSPQERFWLAQVALDGGDTEAALRYIDGIDEGPLGEDARLLRGVALRIAGDYDASAAVLEELRAVSERLTLDAWLELARTHRAKGDLDASLQELAGLINSERSQQIASQALFESGGVRRELAARLRQRDDAAGALAQLAEARKDLMKVVLLHADRAGDDLAQRSYIELVEIAQAMDEPEKARGLLSELIEKYPESLYADFARALLHIGRNETEAAATLLRRVSDRAENEALRDRAATLLRTIR